MNVPEHYQIDAKIGALRSRDRRVTAVYDHAYVARYENYPQRELSAIRAKLVHRFSEFAINVCDVGCGTGAFLEEMKRTQPGIVCCGHDVSPYPLPSFINRVGADWHELQWDTVTFFDSLEHFDSLDFVEHLRARAVIVSLPWYHPYMGSEWFARWKHRRPGEHLWHFTPVSLTRLFAQAGFRPVYVGNPEDEVRKPDSDSCAPNILTMAFRR